MLIGISGRVKRNRDVFARRALYSTPFVLLMDTFTGKSLSRSDVGNSLSVKGSRCDGQQAEITRDVWKLSHL